MTRSAIAPAARAQRWMARESSVRHTPSGHWTRLRMALWTCSCGSWSRESCWRNGATTNSRRVDPAAGAAAVVPDAGVAGVASCR